MRSRRRFARHRTMICIGSYVGVSSSSVARMADIFQESTKLAHLRQTGKIFVCTIRDSLRLQSMMKMAPRYEESVHLEIFPSRLNTLTYHFRIQGMKYLVQEFGLDTQPGRKTPVYIEDIGPFNETILSTQEKKFHLGFQRIQVCLFNSLGIFTVHRRSALLSLQFKDLVISLQKDPRGGPPVPLIELTPEGTKKFLGITKLYGYAIPVSLSQFLGCFLMHRSLLRMLLRNSSILELGHAADQSIELLLHFPRSFTGPL